MYADMLQNQRNMSPSGSISPRFTLSKLSRVFLAAMIPACTLIVPPASYRPSLGLIRIGRRQLV